GKNGDDRTMDRMVEIGGTAREWVGHWEDKAVGQLAVMNDRTSARGTAHERAMPTGRVHASVLSALEVTERECRLAPLIEPQCRWPARCCIKQQCLVERHVPTAAGGSVAKPFDRGSDG